MKVKINNTELEVENDNQFWSQIDNWEPYSFKILEQYLNKDNCLIDVGAWNGVLSLYGALKAKQVYSFEPDNVAFNHFINNIKLNNIKNIQPFNMAASYEDGIQKLFVKYDGDSVSSLIDRKMENYICEKYYDVKTINIINFLNSINNIGLIKIDIEGFEEKLIPNMEKYFINNTPTLYISFHPGWFEDGINSIGKITNTLEPYYNCFNVHFIQFTYEEFKQSLNDKGHCFVFIKK